MEQDSIGALLRTLREDTGRSQTDQASTLSELSGQAITRNEVSRWETEKRLPAPFWQQQIAASFGVEEKKISRVVSTARAKRRKERGGVQRRVFIGAMAALAIPLARTDQPTARLIGRSDVAALRRRTARLRRLDNILGGAETFPVYAAEADYTQRLIHESSHTEDIGRDLLALLAEQQQQAGWAAFDHGQHAIAQQLYDDSRGRAGVGSCRERDRVRRVPADGDAAEWHGARGGFV
ncbi:hypothetical protein [Amycolatopsis sp. cmx-11-51]|uniref:helix-turn-helix domain-containing protein n=1 Tax=Amycolatopsis sp. cmx-11-51 TaxID=2785797 RepID=UPI0039E59AD9